MCQFYRSLPDHPHLPGIAGRETNSVGNKGKQRALDYLSKRVQGKIPFTDCRVNTHFLMLHPLSLNHLYLWRGLLQVTVPNSKTCRTVKPIQVYRTIICPKFFPDTAQSKKQKYWRVREAVSCRSSACLAYHCWLRWLKVFCNTESHLPAQLFADNFYP